MSQLCFSQFDLASSSLVLARMALRHAPPPGIGLIILIVITALGMLVALGFITRRLSRWMPKQKGLLDCYQRLGVHAPGVACPCGSKEGDTVRTYGDCCRTRDVAELETAIRKHLMQRWSHKSYAGRRWSRPMAQRLEDYPIPETIILPRWVRRPEEFEFPISEKLLRKWQPQRQGPPREEADEAASDLPL